MEELKAMLQSLLAFIRTNKKAVTEGMISGLSSFLKNGHERLSNHGERCERGMEHYNLTDQEMKVVRLVRKGLQDKNIADRMELAIRTVGNHLQNIYKKTGTHKRTELLDKLETFGEGDCPLG
jgi:DNA-binding NarL/FixJ family response regulator